MDVTQTLQGMLGGQTGAVLKPLLAALNGGQGQAAGISGANAQGGAAGFDLNAVMDKLRNAGLGQQLDSWVAKGPNESVSPDQITKALGKDKVHQAAQQAGVSDQEAAADISKALPQLFDKLSPKGSMPDPTALQGAMGSVLGGR